MKDFFGRLDIGWLVIGLVVVFVGVYYFLSNTLGFNLGEINWDAVWPILIIAIGGSMLLGAWRHATGREPRQPQP